MLIASEISALELMNRCSKMTQKLARMRESQRKCKTAAKASAKERANAKRLEQRQKRTRDENGAKRARRGEWGDDK